MRKYLLLLLICAFASFAARAATYTVKVGKKITLRCTATAPAGTITHAVFEIADPDDGKYLGMTEYDTRGQTATFVGLEAKANVKVKVTYYYSYRGSYSGRMEWGMAHIQKLSLCKVAPLRLTLIYVRRPSI